MDKGRIVWGIILVVVIVIWIASVGTVIQEYQYNQADINRDGVVDALDMSIVLHNWSSKTGAPGNVK